MYIPENIRSNGAPCETEWWSESAIRDTAEDDSDENRMEKSFHNCGLSTWKQVQAAWRIPTVLERPASPLPVDHGKVANGLSHVSRKFELPGRMKLTDVVGIYVENVWE